MKPQTRGLQRLSKSRREGHLDFTRRAVNASDACHITALMVQYEQREQNHETHQKTGPQSRGGTYVDEAEG